MGDYQGTIFVKPGDPVSIRDNLVSLYKAVESGQDVHYNSTHSTWDDIARQYEIIIEHLVLGREAVK
jgi:hypothetical protein